MIAGIILAAGESKRMGKPKALLEYPNGETLLTSQVDLLKKVGCDPIVVVVGSEADLIIGFHPQLDVSWCVNKNWRAGQFSSIQSGISYVLHTPSPSPPAGEGGGEGERGGILILPIDVVGVDHKTIESIVKEASKHPEYHVIVPQYDGSLGHPVFLSIAFAKHMLTINSDDENARLDRQIIKTAKAIHLPVNDPNIVRNVNTLKEWDNYKRMDRNFDI